MPMPRPFSYLEYKNIIEHYKKHHSIMDFNKVTTSTDRYCVIRHDVEFSIDRALALAKFEKENLNITTSYLFQIRNNCYNLASDINIEKIHQMSAMGHKIGLHVHLGLMSRSDNPTHFILEEANLFKLITGIEVDRFSFHRPNSSILKDYLSVPGLINCYDERFFHHYETPHNNLDVKYFTDSRHKWQHGHPLDMDQDKVQILTHPYSWSEYGYDNTENYQSLLFEKDKETRLSIQRETSTFPNQFLTLERD